MILRREDMGVTEVDKSAPTLVLGGTGTTGRRVAERLRQRGFSVRIGSRAGTPPFEWDDESTWPAVVDGIRAAYICYSPDLSFPGAAETIGRFAKVAVAAGASRLVVLSGRGEEGALVSEQAVRAAGAECTVVRCSWFNQNFTESFLLEPVLEGEIALPVGDAPEPFVDADDIADVATAALTEAGHAGQIYELTGPRLLTFGEAATELSAASGRTVRFVPVTTDEYVKVLEENGMSPEFVELFSNILDGRNAHLTDGVQRALGRAPRDFGDFARAAAASGVWDG